jgi:hypothetical protein
MRTLIAATAFAACTCLATTASAQTCAGRVSFADARWQGRVETGFSSDAKTFGPAVSRGNGTFFGGAIVDFTGYPNLDETAVSIGVSGGAEHALNSRFHVCPLVTLLHQIGPNVDPSTLSSNVLAAGGRLGIVANENQTVQIVPTVGVDLQWQKDTIESGGQSASASRRFAVTRVGVGFVLNKRTAVVPEVIEIFGAAATTTFRITAAIGFGR